MKAYKIYFIFIASTLIASCKKSIGVNLDGFPNGKYVCEFVSDSFPNENYTKEFIGIKGSQMIFTSVSELDSFKQEKIVIDYIWADYFKANKYNTYSISYDANVSANKIVGKLSSTANYTNSHYPTSFTLTYTP